MTNEMLWSSFDALSLAVASMVIGSSFVTGSGLCAALVTTGSARGVRAGWDGDKNWRRIRYAGGRGRCVHSRSSGEERGEGAHDAVGRPLAEHGILQERRVGGV